MSSFQRLLIAAVVVVATVSACSRTSPVQCTAHIVVQDFSFEQYIDPDRWFEIEHSQSDGACVSHEFTTKLTGYPLRSVIRHRDMTTGEYSATVSELRLADPAINEARFKIRYSDVVGEVDYEILATDYTSYAVAYSCWVDPVTGVHERAWVLGRKSVLDIATKRAVDAAFRQIDIGRDLLAKALHDDACVYDEPAVPEPRRR